MVLFPELGAFFSSLLPSESSRVSLQKVDKKFVFQCAHCQKNKTISCRSV